MTDWNRANGLQLAILVDALTSALLTPQDMQQLLLFALDKDYLEFATLFTPKGQAYLAIVMQARAQGWLSRLVDAARAAVPENPKVKALEPLHDLVAASAPAGKQLEQIVREAGFSDVMPWIGRLNGYRRQICRIEIPVNQAAGTGWLVADDLLLTNWHVVRHVLKGLIGPEEVACRFDYYVAGSQTSTGLAYRLATAWCVSHSEASSSEIGEGADAPTACQLDYALLRLAQPIGTIPDQQGNPRGWIPTRRNLAAPATGDIVLLLQHPQGDPLKLTIGTARGSDAAGIRVFHDADTLPGSSGSPCFDAHLDVVALHNASDSLYEASHHPPMRNQAIPLQPILARLESQGLRPFWTT